ncbi:MAG TPA: helix-turn-helix domain-containing protein, partial [Ktedonobacteraceae bacterium]|nr:helix-turn-helix domain-containing protein [Ktedonobacteraceae bacterium]
MSSSPSPTSSASVRNILTLLVAQDAQLVAGADGLERRVIWATRMRARLPAFESVRGGELALLAVSLLRRHDETLPHLLQSLHQEGIAAAAIAAPSIEALGNESLALADHLHLPLILLPPSAPLEEIEREVITFVVSFQGEIERKATEISHQLMQLSIQGKGIKGLCEHLAHSCEKWVVLQDSEQHILYQISASEQPGEALPPVLTDEVLRQANLTRITVPIQIRHEVVSYLSLIGKDSDFDYLERLILGQVAPILALEFARERERSEVETRYQTEAFMDVLQGNYQQADEMLARARLLGYDLTIPQVVVIFELAPSEPELPVNGPSSHWSRRIRDELLRVWPSCWVLSEHRRVTALLPYHLNGPDNLRECEQTIFKRLERVQARVQQHKGSNGNLPAYSGGIGHLAKDLPDIPQSYREARQALEIGQRLFGEGNLHSFARLGIYRLLFHLYGQKELADFYHETLGPLLDSDSRSNGALIETLEGFFRCNGNLSETARSMHLHRNSLLYRLGRIEELLGRSLEDP